MRRALAAATLAALALTACGGSPAPPAAKPTPSDIVVGSFDFPESVILAEVYGQALRRAGYPVQILPNVGTRELVEPALAQGFVTMVPEYAGSAPTTHTISAWRDRRTRMGSSPCSQPGPGPSKGSSLARSSCCYAPSSPWSEDGVTASSEQ